MYQVKTFQNSVKQGFRVPNNPAPHPAISYQSWGKGVPAVRPSVREYYVHDFTFTYDDNS